MKFFVCDDQKQELEVYKKKLMDIASKYNVDLELRTFDNGEKLLFALEEQIDEVDAIYLDINMPVIDGITVASKIKEMNFTGELIFLTVSKDHFLSAFDLGAFNYIVKRETTDERFELIFLRVITIAAEKDKEYILLSGGGENRKIEIDTIDYFEVTKRIVTVFYKGGEFSFPSTIGKVENLLFGKGFVRVHRSFLVNISSIKTFRHAELTLRSGEVIPIGRTYKQEVNEVIKEQAAEEAAVG